MITSTIVTDESTPLFRAGMQDRFGESGAPDELIAHFGLDSESLAKSVESFVGRFARYHQ